MTPRIQLPKEALKEAASVGFHHLPQGTSINPVEGIDERGDSQGLLVGSLEGSGQVISLGPPGLEHLTVGRTKRLPT